MLLKKSYCCKVDVWAFGAVVYEMLTGSLLVGKGEKGWTDRKEFI